MDRKMISFYISRDGELAVHELAVKLGQSKADTYRQLLKIGLEHAPTKPARPTDSK